MTNEPQRASAGRLAGRATSCSNTVRRHVAAEFCRCDKSQNIKSDEFVRLVAATKFCCSDLSSSVYRPYTKYKFIKMCEE